MYGRRAQAPLRMTSGTFSPLAASAPPPVPAARPPASTGSHGAATGKPQARTAPSTSSSTSSLAATRALLLAHLLPAWPILGPAAAAAVAAVAARAVPAAPREALPNWGLGHSWAGRPHRAGTPQGLSLAPGKQRAANPPWARGFSSQLSFLETSPAPPLRGGSPASCRHRRGSWGSRGSSCK